MNGTIWLFPGLGCRYVGMGHDLFGQFPTADALISEAQSRLGYDLREVCLEGSGRKVVPARQEAQVIYVLDCAYGAVLRDQGYQPTAVAGHSLGCWAAAFTAGVFDFQTGLELVTHVEELLEAHALGRTEGMGVVLGLDKSVVQSLLTPRVSIANWNSQEQVVLGGDLTEIDQILSEASRLGAKRAKRLPTDRALHTPLMRDVSAKLREKLSQVSWSEPAFPFLAGLSGQETDDGLLRSAEEIRDFLGDFLDRPVFWQGTLENLRRRKSDTFLEIGPGNVLTQMLSFIDRTAVIRTASEVLEQDVTRSC
ncbi:MAG: acyltransferase domain-containing protein [Planctomycetales bacterium]